MDPTLRPRTFGGFLDRLDQENRAGSPSAAGWLPSTVRLWKQPVPQPQLEVWFWTQIDLTTLLQTAQLNSGTF